MRAAIAVARSAFFALVFYPGSVLWVLAALAAIPFGGRAVGRVSRSWTGFHARCARLLLGIRLKIEGEVPRGAILVAGKHESMYETLQLFRLIGDPMIMAKRELLAIPGWGAAARRYGIIPIDREGSGAALRAMLRAAAIGKASGRAIMIFPEGTRVPHGEAPPMRPGFAGLYRALGIPVVPVAIDSGRCWPKGFVKSPGTITMRFGIKIPPGLPRDEIEAKVHAAINALNS